MEESSEMKQQHQQQLSIEIEVRVPSRLFMQTYPMRIPFSASVVENLPCEYAPKRFASTASHLFRRKDAK